MNGNDWDQLGNDILRTVQDAIESCNYDRLNQTISNTVNQVVDGVARNVRNINDEAARRRENAYHYSRYQAAGNRPPVVIEVNRPTNTKGILLTTLGSLGGVASLVLVLVLLIRAFLMGSFAGGILFGLGLSAVFLVVGSTMMGQGIKTLAKNRRFQKYVKTIGNREYCNIRELAASVRKDNPFVVNELEKMIQKGWFCQGHLDKNKTCLIVTDKMYAQYRQLEDKKEQLIREEEMRKEAQRKVKESQEAYRKALSPEVQKVIVQGEAYVEKLRECNDAIPGEEISAKISHMEMIVDKIFERVEEHPASVNDIRKLMEYYLPTTVKLLEAYIQMDAQPVGGENIISSKREIEATLDTLNTAFEKLLDSLFQEKAWDVSSDISVLNTMLAQEGLKEDGLKI